VARKATPQQKAALDLSKWEVAFNGAEPVRKETIERFSEAFAECGFRKEAFYTCYGLAEATLIVTGGVALTPPVYTTVSASELGRGRALPADEGAPDAQTLVGCGATLLDQDVVIVDAESGERCPAGVVGEIWVAGRSVAQGYWQRPEESERTFCARLPGDERDFLRTGDLGFLDEAGNLFVAGRIKDLIIVDGRNHYPQDIELTVERAHPAIRPGCTAAFPMTDAGQERVVVTAEIGKGYKPSPGAPRPEADGGPLDPAEVIASIRKAVAESHDIRAHVVVLLKPGAAPKTSSGKIQRRATKAAYIDGSLETWGAA
jgi:acyl-CoA synthetase (AMP-forming)/AMP-acid ligase II